MDNKGEFDHKYFVTLALQNKIAWGALPVIIEGLTPTLEKSREVNKFLLQKLEKCHAKILSLEGQFISKNEIIKDAKKDNHKSDAFKSENVACDLKRSGLTVEKRIKKSDTTADEPMDLSENNSLLYDVGISNFESKGNEITKEDVNKINHEIFVFESDLKIKKEFKIERAEGIENQKTEINANEKTKVNKALKSFKCDDCGKTFKRHTALGNHKRTHGDFKCKFCDKKFMIRGNLSRHERVHVFHEYHNSKQKPFFECEFCNGLFTSSQSLDSHLKLKHKECLKKQ